MENKNTIPLPIADPAWRIGIVYASFYTEETDALVHSAATALREAGIKEDSIVLQPCAGSFEIPLIADALAQAKKVDALIGIGIIVQGETQHANLLAAETARGIMDVQLKHGMPFAFEVLHVPTLAIAKQRLDKGREAANAVLHSLRELKSISGT